MGAQDIDQGRMPGAETLAQIDHPIAHHDAVARAAADGIAGEPHAKLLGYTRRRAVVRQQGGNW
jgi:hypothetical protein